MGHTDEQVSTGPTLVVLAAGLGTRFGGLKQLAPIGPRGDTILDYLLERAAGAGFGRAVVVVRAAIEERIRSHLAERRRRSVPVEFAIQSPPPGHTRPVGTAHAVLVTRSLIDGPFGVVNADDLYPSDAFVLLATHLGSAIEGGHALVAFSIANTVLSERPVSRAVLDVHDGLLTAIHEGTAVVGSDGVTHVRGGATTRLGPDQPVSMNMWGFQPSIFADLDLAVGEFLGGNADGEVLLPDVVASLVASGAAVRVLACAGRCIGVTHAEDVGLVAAAVEA